MTDKADSRGFRRRIVLAAIVLLLAVSGFVAWSSSSRTDPRFVGQWIVDFGPDSPWEKHEWELNADGTGVRRTLPDRQLQGFFKWSVNDGHFTTTPLPSESGFESLRVRARQAFLIAIDDPSSGKQRLQFTWMSPDVCELDFEPQGNQQDMPSIQLIRIDDSDSALRLSEHPVHPHD